MSNELPTERDLLARVLLPYLGALGVGPDQIRLEKAFRLRLGRAVVEVKSRERRTRVGGRLDVLVKNTRGENLFVVELKPEGEALTDEDRDQGISYARLLDQIAPFVLLTNGREARLYDTITKEALQGADFPNGSLFWASGRSLATADDLRIRYEALRHFLGYSPENVKTFSHAQQALWMEGLRGGQQDPTKKYIPELYLSRKDVRDAVKRFVSGPGAALAIVGESGVGKTNEICALAEWLGQDHVALFLGGAMLHASIADTLLDEFNWHFGDQIGVPELVRRLSDLAGQSGCRVVVLVDALDEANVQGFEQSTSQFAAHLRAFGGYVKLIVSAKSEEWGRFATFRGDPSPLLLALDTSWQAVEHDGADQARVHEPRPLLLSPFSHAELALVAPKYRAFFRLSEEPHGELRDHCRVPLVLRVTSEVYADRQEPLPGDISEEELLRAWLERKLSRMANPNRARAELIAVARAAYEQARTPPEGLLPWAEAERIPEDRVREFAGLPAVEPVAGELVTHGVLVRHVDPDGRAYLAFYYGRLRDYMIARDVLELERTGPDRFREIADTLLTGHILQGVLFWHLRHAPADHRQVLDQILLGRAASFLDTYERILDELVPGVKPQVEPFTTGRVGIAYEMDPHGLRSYGFFRVGGATTDRILELQPVYDGQPFPFARELWRLGGYTSRGGGRNFANTDPREAAAQFALDRIREAVAEGGLNEMDCELLVQEMVLAIATEHRQTLGLPTPSHFLDFIFTGMAPLDLRLVSERLHAYFGRRYYEDQWVGEQIQKGSKYVRRLPGSSAVSISYDPDALRRLRERAQQEAASGARFPPPNVIGQEDLRVLSDLLDYLLPLRDSVERPILPVPDVAPPYPDDRPHWAYSGAQLATLLERLFTEALRAYKVLVESNFRKIRDRFPLYQRLPVMAVASYQRPRSSDRSDWGDVTYAFVPGLSAEISAVAHVDPEEPIFRFDKTGRGRWTVEVGDKRIQAGFRVTHLRRLLWPYRAPRVRAKGRGQGAAERAPVRAFAYNLIEREMEALKPQDLLVAIE